MLTYHEVGASVRVIQVVSTVVSPLEVTVVGPQVAETPVSEDSFSEQEVTEMIVVDF